VDNKSPHASTPELKRARDKYLANCQTQLESCRNPPKRVANVVAPATNAVAPATNAVTPATNAVPVADSKPTTQPTVPKQPTQQTSISSMLTDKINDLKSSSVQTSKLGKGLCDSNYGCCTRKSACSKDGGAHEVNKNAQSDDMYITKVDDSFNNEFLDYFGSKQSPKFIMEMLSKKAGKPIDKIAYCKKCLKVFCPDNFNEKMLDRPVTQSKPIENTKITCDYKYGCCSKTSGCSKGTHSEAVITKDSQEFTKEFLYYQGTALKSPKFFMELFSNKTQSPTQIDKLSYCTKCLKVFCPDNISDKDFILDTSALP
jgi:hypothetical protein